MDAALRQLVRERAADRCEYCRLPERALDITFHVEHIIARQHGGTDDSSNLCLACDRCNFHKGPNLSSIDPDTNLIVPLFHPRTDAWEQHFAFVEAEIVGLTPTGRASARLLNMNARHRMLLRARLPGDWIE
jgi:5-methylcytosine-specific restriction endonuclease McrA